MNETQLSTKSLRDRQLELATHLMDGEAYLTDERKQAIKKVQGR